MRIKFKRINYNLILGVLVGYILSQIAMFEGYALGIQKNENTGIIDINLSNPALIKLRIAAFCVFVLTVILFNTKNFKKINFNRLNIYLVLVILVSIVVTVQGIIGVVIIIFMIPPNIQNYISSNNFLLANLVVLVVIIIIALFLITFVLLVNRKVKYIKFLTKEVKIIKNEGFGKMIKVKGGDELAELCESINDMSVELKKKIDKEKEIEKNKNELITNISHDLKTPLTSIVGYLELLNSNKINEEDKAEYAKIAYNKSLRLKELVNELFEYTKLANSDYNLEKNKVNISMILNQAVGESMINFMERDIEVVLDNKYSEVYCYADAVQMQRVFDNLIRNAEKYADSNSKFLVSVKIIDKKVNISFMNKCQNIKDKDVKRLFEKFYREDKARSKEGSGLGLAIVKAILELHNGDITAEKIDDNIKFNITLEKV